MFWIGTMPTYESTTLFICELSLVLELQTSMFPKNTSTVPDLVVLAAVWIEVLPQLVCRVDSSISISVKTCDYKWSVNVFSILFLCPKTMGNVLELGVPGNALVFGSWMGNIKAKVIDSRGKCGRRRGRLMKRRKVCLSYSGPCHQIFFLNET